MTSRVWISGGLVLGLALLATVAIAETNAAVAARVYEDGLVTAGYSTLIIEHSDQVPATPLSTTECAATGRIDGVGPVVSIRQPDSMPGWARRGPDLTVIPVGGDIVAFVGSIDPTGIQSWRTAQTFVDQGSSAASQSSPEYLLPLYPAGRGVDTTALAVELDALGPATSGALLVADNQPGPVEACALFVPSDFRETVSRSIGTAFPAVSGFSQRWALTGADRFDPPRRRFEDRLTKDFWIACTAVFTGFWLFYLRLRRPEHGLYAVIGLGPFAITLLTIIELLAIALTASILAAAVIGLAALRADTPSQFLAIGAERAASEPWLHASSSRPSGQHTPPAGRRPAPLTPSKTARRSTTSKTVRERTAHTTAVRTEAWINDPRRRSGRSFDGLLSAHDRDADTYGIRAVESCRARQYKCSISASGPTHERRLVSCFQTAVLG